MVASGSPARRASVHPVLAVVAVAAGVYCMVRGVEAMHGKDLRWALMAGEALLALPGLGLVVLSGVSLAEGLGLRRVADRTAALSALAGATLWAASLGLMSVQFVVWRPPADFLETFRAIHQALRPSTAAEAVLSVLAIALMPALCEETLFRGVVMPSLMRAGAAAGLLGSAALFALIHVDAVGRSPVFYRLPFAFAVGLGLGALRLITGSLVPSILAHAVLNTITFATVFATGAASEAIDEPHALSGTLFLVAGGAATAALFRALRR